MVILDSDNSTRQNLEFALEELNIEWYFEMPLRKRKFKRPSETEFQEWSEEDHEGMRAMLFEQTDLPDKRGEPKPWKVGKQEYHDALLALSNKKQKWVLREYFKNCEPSERYLNDGLTPENWLTRGFNAPDTPYGQYVQSAIWYGMLLRSLYPGWKIKTAPVLTGPSSIGKSPLVEHLLPASLRKDYFVVGAEITGDIKDYGPLLQGKAVIELGEMAGLNRADENRIKQLIDSTALSWTAKYERASKSIDHTFIFVGTANDDNEFLPANTIAAQRFAILTMESFQLLHRYPGESPVENWMDDVRDHLVALTYKQIKESKYPELSHLPRNLKAEHAESTDQFKTRIDPELEERTLEFIKEEREKNNFLDEVEGYKLSALMRKLNMENRPSRHTAKMLRDLGFNKLKHAGEVRWYLPEEQEEI